MWTDQIRTEREAKLDAIHDRLAAAVSNLITGDDWRRAIEFGARFRTRSFKNTLLIQVQHSLAYSQGRVPTPSPAYVAGYRQWQSLGRQVDKGQSGYQILAPLRARFASTTPDDPSSWRRLARGERPTPGETVQMRVVGVRPATVFDVSQTSGAQLPVLPEPQHLTGEPPANLWDGLADQITAAGFDLRLVSNADSIGGANGLTDMVTRSVSIRMDMVEATQVKTLAHELTHVIAHAPDSPDVPLHRGVGEVEAESVALMVLAAHGMDTSAYSVPYVATWANRVPHSDPTEVVAATAQRVRNIAVEILDKLPTAQIPDGNPPGLDRQLHGIDLSARRATITHQTEVMGL